MSLGHQEVADQPDLRGAGDADRRTEHARFRHPDQTGHLAVPVEHMTACVDVVGPNVGSGHDHGDSGADHVGLVIDQGRVSDKYPRNVGDRILGTGLHGPDGKAELTQPGPGRGAR